MTKWAGIFIICLICYIVMIPIEKLINRKITNKFYRITINLLIAWTILIVLYFLADILGIDIFNSGR